MILDLRKLLRRTFEGHECRRRRWFREVVRTCGVESNNMISDGGNRSKVCVIEEADHVFGDKVCA